MLMIESASSIGSCCAICTGSVGTSGPACRCRMLIWSVSKRSVTQALQCSQAAEPPPGALAQMRVLWWLSRVFLVSAPAVRSRREHPVEASVIHEDHCGQMLRRLGSSACRQLEVLRQHDGIILSHAAHCSCPEVWRSMGLACRITTSSPLTSREFVGNRKRCAKEAWRHEPRQCWRFLCPWSRSESVVHGVVVRCLRHLYPTAAHSTQRKRQYAVGNVDTRQFGRMGQVAGGSEPTTHGIALLPR
jgi:hypothetical protein